MLNGRVFSYDRSQNLPGELRRPVPRRPPVSSVHAGCTASLVLANSPASQAIEKATMGVAQLGSFDRSDQRGEVLKRAQAEIAKVVTKDDASKAVRYGTYHQHCYMPDNCMTACVMLFRPAFQACISL